MANGLSVTAIVFREFRFGVRRLFRFGLRGAHPPKFGRCDSPQLSPPGFGCVPHGQWAPLDADMLQLISRSAFLVEPVLAVSRARAGRTEHVQRSVRSLLASVPIARPCSRSCAPPELLTPSCSCRLTATVPATLSFGVLVSPNLRVLCTLSSCHLFVSQVVLFWRIAAVRPCRGVIDLQGAVL